MAVRQLRYRVFISAVGLLAAGAVSAQTYPVKPVRFIVPYTAGGPSDVLARLLGTRLTEVLGKQVIVDNRGGANGNIGMQAAATAPPDGHTIVLATGFTLTVNPHIYRLPYDIERDFAPVSLLISSAALLVVTPTLPAKSVPELIKLAKARPGELTFGSSGLGGFGHISGELFKMLTNTSMIHVPYKSAAPALTDLAAGNITVLFNNLVTTVPMVEAGRVRAIAVTTRERSPVIPQVPTVAEAGVPGYESTTWNGLLAPAGTPEDVLARLNSEIVKILGSADMKQRISARGAAVTPSTPEQFRAKIREETARMAEVVRFAKIKPH